MLSDFLTASVLIGILHSGIRLATPYLFASLGETVAQRSGVLDLGVEGIMLMGAFSAFYVVFETGNLMLGILAAIFVGALMGVLMSVISVTYQAEQGISGIGLYLFGLGLSALLFRVLIGGIGASFVITQYHTSVMFAPNCVGTANATSAGWGNLGGGVTQMVMPMVFAAFVWLGCTDAMSWRLSMVAAGAVCMIMGIAYFFLTTDLPDGNFADLRAKGEHVSVAEGKGSFLLAAKDYRVWALFFIYAACFGIELTINNIAAIYYMDYFDLGLTTAGLVAGLFGLMNIFARTTGGFISDKFVEKGGLRGRVRWLFIALLIEGIALLFFSQMRVLALAIPTMIVFSLFVQMSEGATYSVVPFINKKALGSVSGIVGAGGNMGAVAAGFLFRYEGLSYPQALMILGGLVTAFSFFTYLVRFSPADEKAAAEELALAQSKRRAERKERRPLPALIPGLQSLRPMDALRMYLGIALVVKGIYFIMNMADLESQLGGDFGQVQTLIAWGVVFAHVVGGASLALGFVTRVAAVANAAVLLGAVVVAVAGPAADGGLLGNVDFQFTSFVFFALVLLVWRGAGPWSLDHLFQADNENNSTTTPAISPQMASTSTAN